MCISDAAAAWSAERSASDTSLSREASGRGATGLHSISFDATSVVCRLATVACRMYQRQSQLRYNKKHSTRGAKAATCACLPYQGLEKATFLWRRAEVRHVYA